MRVRVASAGTGKTTSLVTRYLELIDEGRPLRRVAGVTFTRAAAEELRQRVDEALHEVLARGSYLNGLYRPRGGLEPFRSALRELDGAALDTIHGFMIACLRLSAPVLGLDPEFGMLGEWEAGAMFEEELRSLQLLTADPKHPLRPAFDVLGDRALPLSLALFGKRSLRVPDLAAAVEEEGAQERALEAVFAASYDRYLRRLGAALLAPGEVERSASRLLDVPRARERVALRFPVVLVDEYQDVNPLQGRFFEHLEESGVQVEVVGDPKQSIYGFRNADVGVFRRALDRAERSGDVQPPLTRTRRHARSLASFLNRVTDGLAEHGLGFGPREAPAVVPAGSQALVAGTVALHWVAGDEPIASLRDHEGTVLADAMREAHEQGGIAYDDMAVLARSYAGLALAQAALTRARIPNVMLQGRGYYDRSEIRDLYHALRVGIAPDGSSLAPFLRGPFAGVRLGVIDSVLRSPEPLATLASLEPEVTERLEALRSVARMAPLAALKRLVRDPLIGGRRYGAFLGTRARENVDALLFEVAASPPGDLEVLLDRLELLSRQAEAGDVPQTGDGVRLLTVHRSKGLEFRLAAVFDAGRGDVDRDDALYVDRERGGVHVEGGPGFPAASEADHARREQESYRLLYVALSRARDALLVTGSIKRQTPAGWAAALSQIGFGPLASGRHAARSVSLQPVADRRDDERGGQAPESSENETAIATVHVHPWSGGRATPTIDEVSSRSTIAPAPWTAERMEGHAYPPVFSPSRLKAGSSPEPRLPSDPDGGDGLDGGSDGLPGRATAIGTLVHYAISQDWLPADPLARENLSAQEVMFPFADDERSDILDEVDVLLHGYRGLLGNGLPLLEVRDRDMTEVSVAVPLGATVWQGIIDRLYRVDGAWVVEDYKTDRQVRPDRYHFQLALYVDGVERALGVRPRAQLVFLRSDTVVPVDDASLRRAFVSVLGVEGPALQGGVD